MKVKTFKYCASLLLVGVGFWQLLESSQDFWNGNKMQFIGHGSLGILCIYVASSVAIPELESELGEQKKEDEEIQVIAEELKRESIFED